MHYLVSLAVALLAGGGPTPTPKQVSPPEVYLYGNVISAPFRTELDGTVIRINGIQVSPPLTEPTTVVVPPPTPATSARFAFREEGWALQRRMVQEGKCCREITMTMVDLYRKSAFVSEVWDVQDNSFMVRWTDGSEEVIITTPSIRAHTPEEDAADLFQFFNHALEEGCIIIIASSGHVIVPANDADRLAEVHAEIARARQTAVDVFGTESNAYRDIRWKSKYLPPDIAKQFAHPLKLTPQPQEN